MLLPWFAAWLSSIGFLLLVRLQVEAQGQPQPPGPGREMTFEEKRKLSHSMGSLSGERLVHVLQIIAEGPSAPVLVRPSAMPPDVRCGLACGLTNRPCCRRAANTCHLVVNPSRTLA